jgi:hypothetical protein
MPTHLCVAGMPRVFLAGDAAHRFPPAGGFGMNTGIQVCGGGSRVLGRGLHERLQAHLLLLPGSGWLEREFQTEPLARSQTPLHDRQACCANTPKVDAGLCLQDAHNLAWKLALALHHESGSCHTTKSRAGTADSSKSQGPSGSSTAAGASALLRPEYLLSTYEVSEIRPGRQANSKFRPCSSVRCAAINRASCTQSCCAPVLHPPRASASLWRRPTAP